MKSLSQTDPSVLGWFETIRSVMSDGKPRTAREIAESLGMNTRNHTRNISGRMRNYEKYGYCRNIGKVSTGGPAANVWEWIV